MYNSLIIRSGERDRLLGTEAECLIPYIRECDGPLVLLVEKDGLSVGTWALLNTWHTECVWIHPDYKGNVVIPRRLVKGMMQMAQAVGAKNLVTAALNPEVENLIIEHLNGKELPGKHFVFPVKGL